jgi:hypothetical protein
MEVQRFECLIVNQEAASSILVRPATQPLGEDMDIVTILIVVVLVIFIIYLLKRV